MVEAMLFGPVEVTEGQRRLGPGDLGGPKAKQVLELLLVARGHIVTKDRLADQLWGETLPKRAFATLENHVSILRRHLDDVGRGRELVVTVPGGYRLAADRIGLDLDHFDDRITAAGRAGTRMARNLLDDAVRIAARGEVLEDEPYAEWVEELRRTYRARLLGVRLDAAECALAERDTKSAIDHAQSAIAIDPYAERAYRLAMLAHYAEGDQRESLAGYQRLRSLLAEDLALEPTPQAQQVMMAIRAQEDPVSLLPRPLGRQGLPPRLRDSPLVGRRAELRRLEAMTGDACDSTLAIAVIEGEDGAGKTRLLDELAVRLPGIRLGRGTCSNLERHLPYVPLASALRDALGEPAIAAAGLPALAAVFPELGPGPAGSPPSEAAALESLVRLWRAHAPLVLLLDDLHWADPATLASLAYLHRRSAVLPGAVIVAVGAEEALTNHELRRLPATERVILSPLRPEELAEAGLGHLHTPTHGHPRFLAATLDAGDRGQVLASLADVLLARCRAEGPEAYSLLVCAAAMDQPFDPAMLAEVARRGLDEILARLEGLREHRMLEAVGLAYRFRHEMVGEALRQSLSPARLRFLTDRAGLARTTLEQRVPLSPSSFDIVRHPIYVIDPARDRIVEANRACEWLGYSHDELLATPVSAIHPAEFPQLVDWVAEVRGEQFGWSALFNCRAKDGTYTPTDMMALAPDPNGLVVLFTRDRSAHRSRAA
ncbi:MAG TPA: AAA family ATPase [Trebonia sp.]|jgi:DNA-binding SARP family transcriptional activator